MRPAGVTRREFVLALQRFKESRNDVASRADGCERANWRSLHVTVIARDLSRWMAAEVLGALSIDEQWLRNLGRVATTRGKDLQRV